MSERMERYYRKKAVEELHGGLPIFVLIITGVYSVFVGAQDLGGYGIVAVTGGACLLAISWGLYRARAWARPAALVVFAGGCLLALLRITLKDATYSDWIGGITCLGGLLTLIDAWSSDVWTHTSSSAQDDAPPPFESRDPSG